MVGYSKLINGLIAVANGALVCWRQIKRARLFVLLSTTFHFTFQCVLVASILSRLKGPNQRVERKLFRCRSQF